MESHQGLLSPRTAPGMLTRNQVVCCLFHWALGDPARGSDSILPSLPAATLGWMGEVRAQHVAAEGAQVGGCLSIPQWREGPELLDSLPSCPSPPASTWELLLLRPQPSPSLLAALQGGTAAQKLQHGTASLGGPLEVSAQAPAPSKAGCKAPVGHSGPHPVLLETSTSPDLVPGLHHPPVEVFC